MCVPPALTRSRMMLSGARMAVAVTRVMPRKQRFKPSRKPSSTTSNGQEEPRPEVHRDDVEIETDRPSRGMSNDDASVIERSGSDNSR